MVCKVSMNFSPRVCTLGKKVENGYTCMHTCNITYAHSYNVATISTFTVIDL